MAVIPVQLPELKPDQTTDSGVLLVAENVYRALDGYRAIGSLTSFSNALSGTFMGGFSAMSNSGTAYLLAGTATNLYKLSATGSWTSLVGSLSIGNRWQFAQFRNVVITVNGGATGVLDLGTGTWSTLSGAPTGTCVTVVGDQVVIGRANGDVTLVEWSAFNDHTGWTVGTDQCGSQPMLRGGQVMGIAGGEYGVILQRERIVRMSRTGDANEPFVFDEVSSNFGCADGATIAIAGRTVFFKSDRGFMAIEDGQQLRPIGSEKIDRYFNSVVSRDSYARMYAAVDPENKLVVWVVPGSPALAFIYNFELEAWTTATFAASGAFPGFTQSVTVDDLPGLGYTTFDAMTISLDDPRWSGGAPRLYFVGSDNKIGALTGTPMAARLDGGYTQFTPGQRAWVTKVRPITDATTGMTLVMNAKWRIGDNDNTVTESALQNSGVIPIRATGRFISYSLRIAAGTPWSYIQALEVEANAGGLR